MDRKSGTDGIGRLEPIEVRLLDAVESGRPLVPTAAERSGLHTIRAEFIRAILLGTELKVAAGPWRRRPAAPTRYGIRIRWHESSPDQGPLLLIEGELDLRDIAPGEGGFLPPLEFQGCRFDGGIQLSGAYIQSLCMSHCRFASLRAESSRFAGSVRIRHCGPLTPEARLDFGASDFIGWTRGGDFSKRTVDGEVAFAEFPARLGPKGQDQPMPPDFPDVADDEARCEISFRAAAIGAGLEIEKCNLRARRIAPLTHTRSMRDVSALELSHAHVRDRVELIRSTFVGGARFVSAEIGDDLWILGGKFLGQAHRYALDLQFARIAGQLGVKGDNAVGSEREGRDNAFFPVVVIGQLSAIGMSAGEVWIAGGFFHGQDNDEQGAAPTLNFSKADIKRTFKLGLYHPHYIELENRRGDRVYVHGELCLIATNIGKNLEIHGAQAGNVWKDLGLGAEYHAFFTSGYCSHRLFKVGAAAIKVDRRLNITHSGLCAGTDHLPGTEAHELSSGGWSATSAIDLFKATIGTGVKITSDCDCDGAVRLNSCVIGREAIIGCRIINAPPAHKGRDRGVIPWLLDMRESVINGHLKIGRRTSDGDAVTISGGITLESAKVQGNAALRRLTLVLDGFPIPEEGEPPNDRERTALNLRDFVCGSELEVHRLRWVLPELSAPEREVLASSRTPRRWWHSQRNAFFDIENSWHAFLDLRGFRCGLLSDDFGDGWGLSYRLRLRLASMRIGEVEAGSDDRVETRLRWLNYQNRKQRVIEPAPYSPGGEPDSSPLPAEGPAKPWYREWVGLWERHHCSRGDDFVRHAYDVIAQATGRAGEERAAEEITVERKNIQATLRFSRAWSNAWNRGTLIRRGIAATLVVATFSGLSWLGELGVRTSSILGLVGLVTILLAWPAVLALLQLIARYAFRYGFSPDRAGLVLAGCIVVGAIGVHYARYGGWTSIRYWEQQTANGTKHLHSDIVLVLDVPYAPAQAQATAYSSAGGGLLSLEPAGKLQMERGGGTRYETKLAFVEPSPCNLDVSSVLYAADVFIPVLDLDQESRCSIRHADPHSGREYTGWRFLKAIYELLGWIVTSLVILVLSGVMRRDLERRSNSEGPAEAME
ncbi:MAG TPA: pentapeptide repeat-containing protein [Allosphingosinicella sp.]